MVADHYILVQRWHPNFLNSAKTESKVVVWLRTPELPLELYNDIFLRSFSRWTQSPPFSIEASLLGSAWS